MIEIPLIDELREIRGRLSDEQKGDPARYAEMLLQVSRDLPGSYVTHPLNPEDAETSTQPAKT